MNRCLILLAFLCLAFNTGSSIRCYQCTDCGDPFSGDSGQEADCLPGEKYCAKLTIDNEIVKRDCMSNALLPFSRELTGNDISAHICKTNDLCNGSGRISDISIKMLLLPLSLVLVISMFSG